MMRARRQRPEQRGAQRRRQAHRHRDRQQHRRDHGDRELAVDHPGRAAEEGHRHEHRRQHQRDAHQRAGDLLHRAPGGLARRQAFLGHHPLDVLDHHDRVVHQQADGQHQAEHRQAVDRVAEDRQHPEGAQQHHGHGDRRDQGGAPALHEQIHDQHHQHHRLEQGVGHALDRHLHEGAGVVGQRGLQLMGEARLQLGEPGLDRIGHRDRVGSLGQAHAHRRRGPALEAGHDVVVLAAQLDPRDIAQAHRAAVAGGLQHDLAELAHRLQLAARGDGHVELLARRRRQAADLAGGDLRVLRVDRAGDVRGHQPVGGQLRRVEPQPHRMAGAQGLHIAHAVDAADDIGQAGGDVVADLDVGGAVVGRVQRDDHQVVGAGLGDGDALVLHRLGQLRQRLLHLALHLHQRDIDIGAGIEGQRDAGLAGRGAGRGHRLQAVEALHALLDDLGDRILQRPGRGAGIGGADRDARRRDVRILLQRQRGDRQRAGEHHDDGQHPREDGAVDEEAGHGVALLLSGPGPRARKPPARPGRPHAA